jgi:glycosyltransferase involved in cell wall biosynthesis
MRLAIINTHPIQYYAPVFKLLHQQPNISIKVFYTYGENSTNKYDPGFNRNINWDIPLLDGYPYEFIKNTAKDTGTHTFKGIINPDLIDKINAYKPNAILIYGWAHQSHLKAICHFKNKIPVYFRGDSTLLDKKTGVKNFIKYLFLKWVYRHVDYALYTGTNNMAYFKKYGLNEQQLKFVPHSIDNDRFTISKEEDAATLRGELNIPVNDILILFAGKFESKKDPLLLLSAFFEINKPGVHLLFVGNGVLENQLKEKAAGKTNVHFMDFQNQTYMPAVYQAADLFCLPSKGPAETWGLVVNEAMACKKAVLVSDKVGCAFDLVKPGYNGMIFKAGDVDALTDALIYLTNKKLLTGMGEHSLEIIEDWAISVQVKNIVHSLNGK